MLDWPCHWGPKIQKIFEEVTAFPLFGILSTTQQAIRILMSLPHSDGSKSQLSCTEKLGDSGRLSLKKSMISIGLPANYICFSFFLMQFFLGGDIMSFQGST